MLFGRGLRPPPKGDYMNKIFIDIDKSLIDFTDEISLRLKRDNASLTDEEWLACQFHDPLFILNCKPYDKMWFYVNSLSMKASIYCVTSCDLDATRRWADAWEIAIDEVLPRSIPDADEREE